MYDTIIVGGGASGLLLAGELKGKTLLLEALDRVGKKILATGNGRCNLSNSNITGSEYANPEFFHAVEEKCEQKLLNFWKNKGLFTREDTAGRIYPFSNQASTVLDLLRFGVRAEVKTSCAVKAVQKVKTGYLVQTQEGEYLAKNVVLTSGGGNLDIAKALGLKVTSTYPALCAMKTVTDRIKGLDGVRAHAKVSLVVDGVSLYEESGEVLFRNYGVSGIAVFNASAVYARALKDKKCNQAYLSLDLLDGLEGCEVEEVIAKRMESGDKNIYTGIISSKIGQAVLKNESNPQNIVKNLRKVKLEVLSLVGDNAQITVGGVELSEVKPTLESKKHDGLYLCGEILDQDGLCGGYNLHWAFLSALTASADINSKI